MTTRKQIQKGYMLLVVVGLLVGARSALATTYTWTGPATGGTWDQSSNNWDAATTPVWDGSGGLTNSAIFNTASLVSTVGVAGTSVYVSNLTFRATSTLTTNTNCDPINLSTGGAITASNNITATIYAPLVGANTTLNLDFSGDSASLVLRGTNNLTGTLTLKSVQAGRFRGLDVNSQAQLGTAQITIGGNATDGATLYISGSTTITNSFVLNGGTSAWYGRLYFGGNPVTLTGAITLQGTVVMVGRAGTTYLNGSITGANSGLSLSGGNNITLVRTFSLGAANVFTNLVISDNAIVSINNAGALNNTAGAESRVSFTSAQNGNQILRLNGYSITIGSVTNMTTPTTYPIIENSNTVAAALTVGNSKNLSSIFNGLIRDGTGGGTLGLAKAGTGTLTLVNTNQYTGATTVLAGTLAMTNAVKSTTWAVSNSATLIVNGPLDLSTPSRTLTLAAGGGTAGLLQVNGNLTLGGTLTVSATNEVTKQVTLAECTGGGTIGGGVGSFSSTSLPTNTLLKISNDNTKLLLIKKPTGTMISVF